MMLIKKEYVNSGAQSIVTQEAQVLKPFKCFNGHATDVCTYNLLKISTSNEQTDVK